MNLRKHFSDFFRVGLDVLAFTFDTTTGALLVNLGDAKAGYSDSDKSDVWGATQGVMCAPASPTGLQGPCCQAIPLSGGNRDITLVLRDVRQLSKLGTMAAGDSCLFETAGGTARIYARATGEIDIIANGGSQSITIAPSGAITITGATVAVGPTATSVAIAGGAASLALGPAQTAIMNALSTFATSCAGSPDAVLAGAASALAPVFVTQLANLVTTKTTAT